MKTPRIGYCTICGTETIAVRKQRFLRNQFSEYHQTEGLESKDIYKCDQCPAYFIKSLQLYLHKMNIHLKRKCPRCGKSFEFLHFLKQHMEKCQPESLPLDFSCEVENCKKKFLSAERLAHHKKYFRHEETGKIYNCAECSKQFDTVGKLKVHLQYVHGPRTHLCSECGKAFKSKYYLEKHFKLHEGVDREAWAFQCTMCGKKFASVQRLEVHMRIHTQEKPFVCQFCGNSYAHSQGLTRHVKASHKGEQSGLNDVTKKSL